MDIEKMKAIKDVKRLIKTLKDKDSNVQGEAVGALIEIGKPTVELLIRALKDKDTRDFAILILGQIGDARAVDPLIQALKDEDKRMRVSAAGAFREIKDSRTIEPLTKALEHEEVYLRIDAAEALGKVGDVRAVEPLTQALSHESVRRSAEKALEEIKARES